MKLYQHFKGGLYIVMSEDTLDASVDTYDAISKTDDGPIRLVTYYGFEQQVWFSRTFENFHETVYHEGRRGPRFRFITDPTDIMPEGGHL